MIIIFLSISILLMLIDAYVLMGVIVKCALWCKLLFLLPSAAYLGLLVWIYLSNNVGQTQLNWLFWLTLCVVFTLLVFTLFSLIGKGIGLFWHYGFSLMNIIGLLCVTLWLSIALYGIIYGWKRITIENVTIKSADIPENFRGYKIVQLSDFHIGTYSASPKTVEKIVNEVNALNPDLIVFTGDLVNSSSSELTEFLPMLSQLKSKDGVYSVLGNHDYCLYRDYVAPDSPEKELTKVIEMEKSMGWTLLRNESIKIERGCRNIALIGVDNAGSRMFLDKSDLQKAMRNTGDSEFKILLSHDPSHWRREVLPSSDVDLTLSGHTHAMQFKIGNWSPSKWTYPEWGGLYSDKERFLYVSTGIGENVAFRFGAYPQIVLLTLE